MTRTFFKDRRTGSVYVTTEKTFPASGSVPLKAAYKEDTVWIDRSHLDRVKDPHELTTGRVGGQLLVFVLVAVLSFFTAVQTGHEYDISFAAALWLQSGWSVIWLGFALRYSGAVHG